MRRIIILALIAPLLASATVAGQARAQMPRGPAPADEEAALPVAGFSKSVLTIRDSVVALARAQLGRRYVFGGAGPERGFDCSGLVQYVMRALGLDVPRTAAQQARVGVRIARDTAHLQPGDLLVFGTDTLIEHVGIYVGAGRFVHASSVAGRVIESPIRRPPDPLIKPWVAARRVTPARD